MILSKISVDVSSIITFIWVLINLGCALSCKISFTVGSSRPKKKLFCRIIILQFLHRSFVLLLLLLLRLQFWSLPVGGNPFLQYSIVVPSHCYGDHKYSPSSKLRQLGTPNGIVDDLDFKLFKFDRRLQCESDSKSTIAILI